MNTNLRPTHMRLVPCREGTKQSCIVDLLARPEGAAPEELLEAVKPWSLDTLKSALYWDINKVKGYGIRSENDRLFLVLPEGVSTPLPHTPLLPVEKPTAHQLEVARRIEEDISKSVSAMRQREVLNHCHRLDLKTASGKDYCATAASDLRRRLRSFLESS